MVLFVTISSGSSQQGFRVSFLGEGRCVDSGRDGDTGFFFDFTALPGSCATGHEAIPSTFYCSLAFIIHVFQRE